MIKERGEYLDRIKGLILRRVSKLNFTYHGKRQRRGRSSWPRGRQGVGVDPGAGVQEGARVGVERRN